MPDQRESRLPPFRLLDLPPELWVRIGKLSLDGTPQIDHQSFVKGRQRQKQLAITRTCAALRHELLAYYYSTKVTFQISLGQSNTYCKFRAWLQAIGKEHRRLISGIVIFRIKEEVQQEVLDRCKEIGALGVVQIERAISPSTHVVKYQIAFNEMATREDDVGQSLV